MIGLAQGAFDKSVKYALERKQFGQAVGKVSCSLLRRFHLSVPFPSRDETHGCAVLVTPPQHSSTEKLTDLPRRPKFQGMQMQFAEAATEIEAARLLTYNAARLKEEGADFTKQAAMAKYYSSVVAQKTAGSAIEWAGGMGFTR